MAQEGAFTVVEVEAHYSDIPGVEDACRTKVLVPHEGDPRRREEWRALMPGLCNPTLEEDLALALLVAEPGEPDPRPKAREAAEKETGLAICLLEAVAARPGVTLVHHFRRAHRDRRRVIETLGAPPLFGLVPDQTLQELTGKSRAWCLGHLFLWGEDGRVLGLEEDRRRLEAGPPPGGAPPHHLVFLGMPEEEHESDEEHCEGDSDCDCTYGHAQPGGGGGGDGSSDSEEDASDSEEDAPA
jgi:hypothetical protein